MPRPEAYTSNAKTWWQKNSDRLGSDLDWDTFCEIWMAALSSDDVSTSRHERDLKDLNLPSTQHCENTCRRSKWRDSSSGVWCYDITKTTPLACSITEIKRVKKK